MAYRSPFVEALAEFGGAFHHKIDGNQMARD